MAYQNMVCVRHYVDFGSEQQGQVQNYPGNYISRGVVGEFPNQCAQIAVPASSVNPGNIRRSDLRGYYNTSMNHPNQLSFMPTCQPVPSTESGFTLPASFYDPHQPIPSSGIYAPVPQTLGSTGFVPLPPNYQPNAASMDEILFFKQKDAHVSHAGFASSSSSSASFRSGFRQWDASQEQNVPFPSGIIALSERHPNSNWPGMEVTPGNGIAGIGSIAPTEVSQHNGHMYAVGQIGQSFQPPCSVWPTPSGHAMADGVPHWHYSNTMGPLHYVPRGVIEHHIQTQTPYQQPPNSVVFHGVNPPTGGLQIVPRVQSFLPGYDHSITPSLYPRESFTDSNDGITRFLPSQHPASADLSGLHEGSAALDDHSDMRLDIDSMSYEELLALEERIGNVNTGLSEQYIMDNLRTSSYTPGTLLELGGQSKTCSENDICIICQFHLVSEQCEVISTLDCGHPYHVDCIKQWLLLKNLCPVCKMPALPTSRSEG